MKKITMTVAVLLTVLSTAFASSVDGAKEVRANIVPSRGSVYKLFYTNEESMIVKVRVFDEDGNRILTDSIKNKEGFVRPYNFVGMAAGTYTIELTDKYGVFTEKVNISE